MKMSADFHYLVFLNYKVERNLLASRIPEGVQLQLFNGTAYLSIVAFLFKNLQVAGIPAPFHQEFEEVNLRFYVKQHSAAAEKRGVVFIREIVPKTLLASAARILFNEKFIRVPMSHHFDIRENQLNSVEYRWRTEHQENYVRATYENLWTFPEPNSAEHFFTARPHRFTRRKDGTTNEMVMEHPLWRTTPVLDVKTEFEIPDIFGTEFVPYLTLRPASAFIAEGSAVTLN
jgi:uncharacterized protein YqjF (DUF2071 family)